jgi:mannosyl-3-phosphoglycerate phosphatase
LNRDAVVSDLAVFTDLDGTLLDHDTYDWTPARPALTALRAAGVPVIPVTSKTLAELDVLCAALRLDGPRVAENGAVLAFPGEPPRITAPGIARIRTLLAGWRRETDWRFRGFGDMNLDDIVAATGLDAASARRAAQRLASEPVLWEDDDTALEAFRNRARQAGLATLQGGRFLHVLGVADKGTALRRVADALGGRRRTVALGDSPNDLAMLRAADVPVIVRRKRGEPIALPDRPDARITPSPGPAGWNRVILDLLAKPPVGAAPSPR